VENLEIDASKDQLLATVEDLEIQNEEQLEQIEKLEGIRGALEEKVSAYRYRLKELTTKIEDIRVSSSREIVVYHNKDNLERRRFVLQKRLCNRSARESLDSSKSTMHFDDLQDKYERLLEQYMYECDQNEKLFDYLFQKEDEAVLELFVKADAADTLLEATTVSRKIIQRAEEQARSIGANLEEQLNSILKQKSHLSSEMIDEVKFGLRCLEN
jgi:hypothetical protein